MKEFGLIFCVNGDIGFEWEMEIFDYEIVESNLEMFLNKWEFFLFVVFLDFIINLRKYMRKGCCLGILVGVGI